MEHVLPMWTTSWISKDKLLHMRIELGVRVSSLGHQEMMDLLHSSAAIYEKAKYLLVERKGIIGAIVHKDASAADVLQSYIHALVVAKMVVGNRSVHWESQSWMDEKYEVFIHKLKSSGWKTERLLSPSLIWKANWITEPLDKKID